MELIKKLRAKTGLNQKKFADLIGVTQSAVCRWENRKTKPDISSALRIVEIGKKYRIRIDIQELL